jgi:hypothetical protein
MLRVVSTQRIWQRSSWDILRAISNHSSGGSFLELVVIVVIVNLSMLRRGCPLTDVNLNTGCIACKHPESWPELGAIRCSA